MSSVLFLALSGVRIHNAGLRDLGLTLPAFAERGETIAELPSLGLLTLAALTPSHWDVEYRELDAITDDAVEELVNSQFAVIAISALTARILEAYELADQLRTAGKIVVMGGLHVSAMPAEASQHADAIVTREAERTWPVVLADIETRRLKKIYTPEASFDFAHAPLPRYDLLNPEDYNRLSIQTTRGCPLDCEFCGASRLISPYKKKPMALIRRDIEFILGRWPRPFIELADDNTFVHRGWSLELARLLSEYNFHWFTETDISVADDEGLLDVLAESGCAQLLIGFESTTQAALAHTDSRHWKERRLESYIKDIERIQQRGISVNGCFTIGLDGDTAEVFQNTLDFIGASKLSHVQVTVATPFPGTGFYKRIAASGRLLPGKDWNHYTLFDVVHEPTSMSTGELEEGFYWLTSQLYEAGTVQQRIADFRSNAKAYKKQTL